MKNINRDYPKSLQRQGFPDVIAQPQRTQLHCRRHRRCEFDSWIERIPWSRKWQLTPVFLPGKSHGQRSLVGYSPKVHKESDMTEHTLECRNKK